MQVTNGWLLHKPIQRSGVKHSVGKVISQTNLGRQETSCKLCLSLILRTPMDEQRQQLGYVVLWSKEMGAHWTNDDFPVNFFIKYTLYL